MLSQQRNICLNYLKDTMFEYLICGSINTVTDIAFNNHILFPKLCRNFTIEVKINFHNLELNIMIYLILNNSY